jgi:hypothetical protein
MLRHIRQIIAERPSIINSTRYPMQGQKPTHKFVIPAAEQQERSYIGAEWSTQNASVCSCRIKLPFDLPAGTELSFIRVPNEPKPAQEQQPPQQTRGPTRTAPRQRAPQGTQPRGVA